MRKPNHSTRGMTLVEAVLAIGVLAMGLAGISGLLAHVSTASHKSSFLNASLDAFTKISAQVQNAACDMAPGGPQVDPRLTTGACVPAFIAGSEINAVGLLDASASASTSPIRVVC